MIETFDARGTEIDKKEVLRYLGYGRNQADASVMDKIDAVSRKMADSLSCRACYEKYPITLDRTGKLCFGTVSTISESLKKNLADCSEVIVFAATVGIEADRIISKNSALSPTDAVISQAVGATFIEMWCDILCERFAEKENGKFLRPRFSPGYGDFPLDEQKEIFKMLDLPRKIGITLTDSLLMVPSKSVTAVIGLGTKNLSCSKNGCEVCENKDCQYRRC